MSWAKKQEKTFQAAAKEQNKSQREQKNVSSSNGLEHSVEKEEARGRLESRRRMVCPTEEVRFTYSCTSQCVPWKCSFLRCLAKKGLCGQIDLGNIFLPLPHNAYYSPEVLMRPAVRTLSEAVYTSMFQTLRKNASDHRNLIFSLKSLQSSLEPSLENALQKYSEVIEMF